MVSGLVKHFIPDISDEDLKATLGERKSKKTNQLGSVLADADNLELAKEAFDEEDQRDFEDGVKKSIGSGAGGGDGAGEPKPDDADGARPAAGMADGVRDRCMEPRPLALGGRSPRAPAEAQRMSLGVR